MFAMIGIIIVGAWILCYPLADVIFHHLQWGAFHAGDEHRQIALTFDDGPAEDTPMILAALKRLNVQARYRSPQGML